MLKLLTFRGGFDEPSSSPFCVKAMILLDMAGVDWAPDWRDMPGPDTWDKLPALEASGALVPDSTFIAQWLEARGHDLHPGLTPLQRAQTHAILRMVEENLRYGLVHDRWLDEAAWPAMLEQVFGGLPPHLLDVVPAQIRAGIRDFLTKQGMANIPEDKRAQRLNADLDALEALLGDNPWLFGDRPVLADAATLPVLSMIDHLPQASALRDSLRARPALMAYVQRGRAQLYPKVTSAAAAA